MRDALQRTPGALLEFDLMAPVAVISKVYREIAPTSNLAGREFAYFAASATGVPPLGRLAASEVVMVLGALPSPDLGLEMGGVSASLLERGKLVVVAYNVWLDGSQARMVHRAADVRTMQSVQSGEQLRTAVAAFEEYFRVYGISAIGIGSERDDVVIEPLGWPSFEMMSETVPGPAAARFSVGRGALYVVPFHVAALRASHDAVVTTLLDAVENHEAVSGGVDLIPAYLEDMRLPGENDRLEEIARLTTELAEATSEANRLRSFRSMIGGASGAGLERLVIDALNEILAASDYEAIDLPDTGAEDFWIVGPEGDFALVEVKGINTSVRRTHVNQVDDHRSRLGRDDGQPPGLLVVNTYRKADELGPKQEDVHPEIRAHAVRQNVLVLTGLDLYELLGLALAGEDAAGFLTEGLSAGGGWLKVRASGAEPLR